MSLSGPRGRTPDDTADTHAADPWAHTAPVYDGAPSYARRGYPGEPTRAYGYPPDEPPEEPPGRTMSPLAIAGMIAAILISVGLVFALLSPVFSGKRSATAGPNLPGVLPESSAGTLAPQAPVPELSADPPTPSESPSPSATSTPAVTGNTAVENAVVALVNAERKKAKCDPVDIDERLRTAARVHSTDMATRRFLSHKGSDGSSPNDRMREAGYDDPASENLARGFTSAKEVTRGWLHDRGDRANIVDCDAKAVGVGVAVSADGTAFWTQDFGN